MRYVSRAFLAGGLGLAASVLTACGGGSGLLSPGQASTFNGLLNQASTDVSNGRCASAIRAIGSLQTQVAALPGSVDPTLVQDLSRGAETVGTLARRDCGSTVSTGTDTAPTTSTTTTHTTSTPTTTSTSTTTTTSTTPTETTPSTSISTPTTPSTPATTPTDQGTTSTGTSGGAPTGGDGGGGQGNGQGNGN